MPKTIFSNYDGTGRQPREIQKEVLDWVQENMSKEILAMNLSTGAGKSFLAKTIADRLGAHVITPANALVDQYIETYPAHNALKGKTHYSCSSGLSCHDWTVTYKQKPCPHCPYEASKKRALEEPTFFNPMSLYYLTMNPEWKTPRTLIVDECFPGNQYIKTDKGNLTIKEIHQRIEAGDVLKALSYNEVFKKFEYKNITKTWEHASRKNSVEVALGNRKFRCTEDHKILSYKGWVSAGELSPGDGVVGMYGGKTGTVGLTDDQLQLFYGSYLGDGSVDWRNKNHTVARLRIVHGEDQLEYLKWKLEILQVSTLNTGSSGYGTNKVFNGQTKSFFSPHLTWESLLSRIDSRGLAIWFMDDGTLTPKGDIVIHTNAFNEKEVTDLQTMLTSRFGVYLRVCKSKRGYYYLRGNRENSSKFMDIVESFIPNCMAKKTRDISKFREWRRLDASKEQFCVVTGISATNTPDLVYDIEVEDNHNFLAVFNKNTNTGFVAHNCHTLSSMLLMLCGMKLPFSKWKYPAGATSELVLVPYLESLVRKLQGLLGVYAKGDPKTFKEIVGLYEQTKLTLAGIREDAQNYAIYETEGTFYRKKDRFLHINPLKPPRFITQQLLDSRRLILMSGTLFKPDIEDLIGDRYYEYLDLPSPIPVENRRIYYKPAPFPMNFRTDPRDIVRVIETVLDHHPGQNTIIHVTYSMSEKIRRYFRRPIIFNTSSDKDARIAEFKEKGGIFLAAGCAEGIDLPGDLCRLNIIPKMPFPDLGDVTVQKRKALADGDDWYKLSTFKTLIQQCGRSTRNETDFSKTYILDSSFSRNIRQVQSKLPKYFNEAIVWSSDI